jgi:NAD(P)-dependent dehydrogenase (short-subunit alcohol dehydrogenase family)
MNRFAGRVAIVTGGASGIGAATVRRLASEGASIAIADLNEELGRSVADGVTGRGQAALFRRCDVSSLADWQALADDVLRRFGRIDIVHNNAAVPVGIGVTHDVREEDWDRQLAVTLKQIFLSVKTCMPSLMRVEGSMINTSSVHAVIGFAQHASYDAAKGAICAVTRSLAAEYAPRVRVNTILPGAILTPAWNEVSERERAENAWQTPMKRLGGPEEVAAVVSFLASEDASFITGASVVVDGGWSITKYFASHE